MLTGGRDTVAVPSLSGVAHIAISLTRVITGVSPLHPGLNMVVLVMMYRIEDWECPSCKQGPLVFIRDGIEGMYREDSGAANDLLRAEGGMDVFIKKS